MLGEALSAARAIDDAQSRAWVLAAVAERLPAERALAVARGIDNAGSRASALAAVAERLPLPTRQAAEMSAYSAREEITSVWCDWVVERDGFEPEVPLAVLPTAQSETPVPPKSATVILAQETGARSPCAAPDAEPFRIAERPASIRSPSLVANAEISPRPREVVGAHRILGTLLR